MSLLVRPGIPVLIVAALFLSACTNPASKLERYGVVPEFQMTDSEGRPFNSKSLAGSVWVVDFIYTSCPAECPMMTARMRRLEQRIRGQENVRLVSISVDPRRDTPPVLAAFAQKFGGSNDQWTFLTGTPASIHQVAYTTFHVGDVIDKINHSSKFVLVDKKGQIRGYYSTLDPEGMPSLERDMQALRHEPG